VAWLETLGQILDFLIGRFGPNGTIAIFAIGLLALLVYRVYQDRRRDRWAQKAIDGKEETIQRLAASDREWRIYFMIQAGMTRREAEKIVQENRYLTPKEAREALEGRVKKGGRRK